MPYMATPDDFIDYAAKTDINAAAPTTKDRDLAASYLASRNDSGMIGAVLGATVGGALDLVDTVGSSVGLTERQGINNGFLNAVGSPGLTAWFDENRGAAEVGSAIGGVLLADYAAGKLLKPAGLAMKAIRAVPFAKNIATLDRQYDVAMRLARITQNQVAKRGLNGVDRMVGGEMTFPYMGAGFTASRGGAVKNLFAAGAKRSLARNVTTEAIMATTLNENNTLYSDELSHNLIWGAVGLAGGGMIDSMITTYALRKMANSEQVRQLNRGAYDVTGLEGDRLDAFKATDDFMAEAGIKDGDYGLFFQGGGGTTDKVVSLSIQAVENQKTRGLDETSRVLFGQREKIATPQLTQAAEEMQKVTVRGLRGVAQSGVTMAEKGFGDVITASLKRDPTSMMGIEEIGTTVGELGFEGTFKLREQGLTRRLQKSNQMIADGGVFVNRKQKDGSVLRVLKPLKPEARENLIRELTQLRFAKSGSEVVMLEAGEWAPRSHAAIADNYTPRKIEIEGALGLEGKAIWSVKRDAEFKTRLGVGSSGEQYLPEGKSKLEQLEPEEMIHMFHAHRAMADHFVKTGMTFSLPEKPNWLQLDLAERIAANGTNTGAGVQWPAGMTRETAKVESFAQKVDLVAKRKSQLRALKKMGLNSSLDSSDVFKIKVMLNLPRIDSYTAGLMQTHETPLDLLVSAFKSGDEVRKMSHADIIKSLNDSRVITGLTEETPGQLKDLAGTSFDFLTHEGQAIAPIAGIRRPLSPIEWTRDDLFMRQTAKAAYVKHTLTSGDELTQAITDTLTSDPSFPVARDIRGVADDQTRSMVPGFRNSAPQTTFGAIMNSITFKNRRDVDAPVNIAASHQQELKNRVTNPIVKAIFERNMGDSITRIQSANAARSRMLLNQMLTFREGWILKAATRDVKLPSGERAVQFVLDHESELNKARFRDKFGRELGEGQALLNPDGKDVVLDELALEVLTRMQGVHKDTLAAKNTALRSQGLPEIQQQEWYTPAPSIKGKYLAFTFDVNNKVVPNMTIVADTPQQLTAMKSELQNSDHWKDTYQIRTKDDVTSFMTLWDKAQMDFIMPNVTPVQSGKQNLGRLAGLTINENAFADALVTMRDSLMSHADDVLEILHDDVIKSARTRAEIAKVESVVGAREAVRHSSQYDRYLQNLTGKSALGAKDSFLGDVMGWLENSINGVLKEPAARTPAQVAAKGGKVLAAYGDWIRAAIPGKSPKGEKFNQFAKELGQYMPYKSAAEMVERQKQAMRAPEVADLSAKLSWFEAGSRLRWFESMHALVNVGSIVANTPAVMRAMQPKLGESLADAAARNSSLSMSLAVDSERGVIIPNVPKLLWQGMRDQWKNTGDEFIERAKELGLKQGMMNQEVAEYNAAWGAIESKAGWRKVMFGDANHGGSGLKDRFIRSGGIDKAISLASDHSENFTRQWGMQMGYRVGRAMGIEDPHALNNIAKEITDKLITNYDPRNRPEIFQGPLGAMAGLFQSYAFNYYGRLFRYVETKDAHSFATQYAMQSALFGTASNPGWEQLNWAFFDRGQGKQPEGQDPVESIYHRFGPAAGDLIMHGTIASLPKIFGLDGVSVYTRGDSEVRLPVVNMPIIDTATRVFGGIAGGVKAWAQANEGIGMNQIAEIASNMITNRPIAGLIEGFGTHRNAGTMGPTDPGNYGYDTSWDGQVVAESVNMSEAVYRGLGIRSMAQQKKIEAFYQNKSVTEDQAARKDTLRTTTRAAIRDGRFDEVDGLFAQYVQEGGDPRFYSRWLKDTFSTALESRSDRQLEKALKDPNNTNGALIGRLLDSQIDTSEDDSSDDDYGRQAQIDNLIKEGWQQTPEPEMIPLGTEPEIPPDPVMF